MDRKTGEYAQSSSATPLARAEELVVEEIGDERLVYDLRVNRAHSLSMTAAQVWQRCDGKTSVAALAADLDVEAETVQRALDELESCDLLEARPQLGSTRRELGIKVARVGGGAALATPLIISLTAQPALALLTPTIDFCTMGGTSHGCGMDCTDRQCCCCCQQIPDANVPALCGMADGMGSTMCCIPLVECTPVYGGNCSAGSCP